jgi:ankyrin repeat protein
MTPHPNETLWQAARDGDLDAINSGLSQGAQINARGSYGDTALNLAAENGHLAVVERLLEAGADIENLGGADKTPLMNAAFAGHTRIVQALLHKGARISHDLLSSLQLKVNILEENAEAGMVNPAAAEAWRNFLEYMIEKWKEQNPQEGQE